MSVRRWWRALVGPPAPRPDRPHAFRLGPVLHEPGISDIDGGAWARRVAWCPECGDVRRVWRQVSVANLDLTLRPCDPRTDVDAAISRGC